jgi:hypothetical protein
MLAAGVVAGLDLLDLTWVLPSTATPTGSTQYGLVRSLSRPR